MRGFLAYTFIGFFMTGIVTTVVIGSLDALGLLYKISGAQTFWWFFGVACVGLFYAVGQVTMRLMGREY